MINIIFEAMMFARKAHANQKRKYTGAPYTDHLAEVAGIVSSVLLDQEAIAVAWLHDVVEDTGTQLSEIKQRFGYGVMHGVEFLSDMEEGNRATRKELSRKRLTAAPAWVQSIKLADLISNTSSIVLHDPKFAKTYLEEKRLLLEVMTKGDSRLYAIAQEQCWYTEKNSSERFMSSEDWDDISPIINNHAFGE